MRIAHRLALLVTLTGLAAAPVQVGHASDNDSGIHRHLVQVAYHLNTGLPGDWKGAIREGAKAWTDRARLRFVDGGETNSTNPDDGIHNLVWRGAIPSSWQTGCPPANTLACARWRFDSVNHLFDTDLVFNSSFSMGTSSFNCLFDLGYDVQTIAVHEFGHWGVLQHTNDSGAAMFGAYNDCQRTPGTHDITSMNENYAGH